MSPSSRALRNYVDKPALPVLSPAPPKRRTSLPDTLIAAFAAHPAYNAHQNYALNNTYQRSSLDPPTTKATSKAISSTHTVVPHCGDSGGLSSHVKDLSSPNSSQTPTLKGYLALPTTQKRVARAVSLFNRQVRYLPDPDMNFSRPDIESWLSLQHSHGLSKDEGHSLIMDLLPAVMNELKDADQLRGLKLFGKCVVTYLDLSTDVYMIFELYRRNQTTMAILCAASLSFSMVIQAIVAISLGQPLYIGALCLLGLKPAIESIRDVLRMKPFKNQKVNNELFLMLCRMFEVIFESIPQSCIQMVALLRTPSNMRTNIQLLSLIVSFTTTGSTVAFSDREMDLSKFRRADEPGLFGYVPKRLEGRTRQMFASVFFYAFYKASKVLSIATLASANGVVAFIYLVLELSSFAAVRHYVFQNFLVFKRITNPVAISFLTNFGWYFSLLAAPFPIIRTPTLLTPRVYALGLGYMMASNFVILFVSYRVLSHDDGGSLLPESTAWKFLSAFTLTALTTGAYAFHLVPNSHKGTFYKHRSFHDHIRQFHWRQKTAGVDHHLRPYDGLIATRALLPTWCSDYYLPKEQLVEFFTEEWPKWCNEERPGEWFDDDYRDMIDKSYLINVPEENWEGGRSRDMDALDSLAMLESHGDRKRSLKEVDSLLLSLATGK